MSDTASRYPLTWPTHQPRTRAGDRRSTPFKSHGHPISIYEATKRLELELDRLGARSAILSTNVELRLDGTPRSDRREPDDNGAACYFKLVDKPIVLASDSYRTVAGNIAALAAHVEATRAIERYGVGSIEQLYTGFTALPTPRAMSWRDELGPCRSLVEAEARWKDLIKTAHPDRGGSEARAAALNAAIDLARKEFGR